MQNAAELVSDTDRAEVVVVGPDVDPKAFRPRRRGPGVDVVFVGRLEIAHQGLDLLIDAWARVAGRIGGRLVLVGTGPDEDALRERAERHGVADRVVFAGWVSGEARYALVANARLAVVPSRVETSGIAAVEALACGTAVVASDVPGLREVVPHEAGVLVPHVGEHAADVKALATALRAVALCEGLRETAATRGPALAAVHDRNAPDGAPPVPTPARSPGDRSDDGPVTTRFPRNDVAARE